MTKPGRSLSWESAINCSKERKSGVCVRSGWITCMHHILPMPLQRVHDLPCPCLIGRPPNPPSGLHVGGALTLSDPINLSRKPLHALGPYSHLCQLHKTVWHPSMLDSGPCLECSPHLLSMTHSQSFTGSFFVTLSLGPSAVSDSISEAPIALCRDFC